jgi:hypothetical protein
MMTSRVLLPLTGLLMLTIAATLVAADVDWTDEVTDPSGDVIVAPPGAAPEASADILSVSLGEEGDNMTVTMTLAGENAGLFGSYNVTVIADGNDAEWYEFKLISTFLTVTGHDLPSGDAEVSYSEDKETIIWSLPKSEVSAVADVVIQGSMSMVTQLSGSAHFDYAPDLYDPGNGNGGGKNETTEPQKMTILWEVTELTHVRITTEMYVQGDDADEMRSDFDANEDGTVTQAEFDQLMSYLGDTFAGMNSTNMTLDGKGDSHTAFAMTYKGVVGPVESSADVVMTMVLDIYFDAPEDKDTHTYGTDWDDDGSSDDDGLWNVTDDSWFKMTLPSGWEFDTKGWSSDLKGFLNSAGDVLEMTGTDLQADWNATMGGVSGVVIRKEGSGRDGDDDSPGFGTAALMVATSVAILVALGRRRGLR